MYIITTDITFWTWCESVGPNDIPPRFRPVDRFLKPGSHTAADQFLFKPCHDRINKQET